MNASANPIGDKFLEEEFCYSSQRIPKHVIRRQARHVASHVDFRENHDLDRIPKDDNPRRRLRSKPQHCPSCHCQPIHDNSPSSRFNEPNIRNNCTEKLEATLTQHLDYSTPSKIANLAEKNNHTRPSASSPRCRSAQQRFQQQYHRPGTSSARQCQDCNNNLGNATLQRCARKPGNTEKLERRRIDSGLRDNVPTDVGMDETDFRLSHEQTDSRKFSKLSNFYSHYTPGEPHWEHEIDSSANQRCRDHSQSKRGHSGQGESAHDHCRRGEMKPWIETADTRDDWKYDRDQQELKELREGVRQFEKRRSAGWNKQRREQIERDEDSPEMLERIKHFIKKVPISQQGRSNRAAARTLFVEGYQPGNNTSIDQSRIRTSKIDGHKTYHLNSTDPRTVHGVSSKDREVEKNSEHEFIDIQPAISRRAIEKNELDDEDEPKVDETDTSETEEEARQLAIKETEVDWLERELSKICGECELTDCEDEKEKEIDRRKSTFQTKAVNARERCKGQEEKETNMYKAQKLLSGQKLSCCPGSDSASPTYEDEFIHEKKTNSRARVRAKKETEEKIHEEAKHNCCKASCGAKDLELEASKTRTCIDEMIDSGLNRETKRGSAATLRETKKDFQIDAEAVSEHVPLKRGTSDEEFAKTLKNQRLTYLEHMRRYLNKLFDLERCFTLHSSEKQVSLPPGTADINVEANDANRFPEKRDKGKERVTMQLRL